ncbi:MAG: diaminopimelate epimerase, partial [Peptococcaceae bacterium]|nr:diaminopimelate epimerase [Peptococcaceae bacterium]
GVPMIGEGQAISVPISVEDKEFIVTAVGMGNPHCVTFIEDLSAFPIEYWGPRMETSSYFPRKTNVEYVQVYNENEVRMRVWERGAAVTMACGTGSCATAVACVLNGKTGRDVLVHLDGGDLRIRWDEEGNHLFMTGPAETIFTGVYPWEVA